MLKVYIKQGNTSWEEWCKTPEEAIETISSNPYNYKYNEFAISDKHGVILLEDEWWHSDMVDEEGGESKEWVIEQNNETEEKIEKVFQEEDADE